MNYRARWIDEAGVVLRDERFEWDPSEHESWGMYHPMLRAVGLVIDAPYFKAAEIAAHVGGMFDRAVTPDAMVIVNDEGIPLGMRVQEHPSVLGVMLQYGAMLYGPCILVERVEAP